MRLTTVATLCGVMSVWCGVLGAGGTLSAGITVPAYDYEIGDLLLTRLVIARSIIDREPVEPGESFPGNIGTVFCFTEVEGAGDETHVVHVWHRWNEEVASVELPVRSERWRTWSSKRIPENGTGEWLVQILDSEGTELGKIEFEITEP